MKPNFILRPAELKDMKSVFDLSNDPIVRRNSINTVSIPWEQHVKWFIAALEDASLIFLVVESVSGEFMGQVRFKKDVCQWVVSISIAAEFRGKGLGSEILLRAMKGADVQRVRAYIKQDNMASRKLFERSGFSKSDDVSSHGDGLVCMDWVKHDI